MSTHQVLYGYIDFWSPWTCISKLLCIDTKAYESIHKSLMTLECKSKNCMHRYINFMHRHIIFWCPCNTCMNRHKTLCIDTKHSDDPGKHFETYIYRYIISCVDSYYVLNSKVKFTISMYRHIRIMYRHKIFWWF